MPKLTQVRDNIMAILAPLLPASLGQKTMANSFAAVLASDQSPLDIAIPATPYNGLSTVAAPATAEVLAAAQALESGVQIKAESDNTGIVYVGDAAVSAANGYHLLAGETIFLAVDNLDEVWLDVSVAGDGVKYLAS